MQRIDDGRPVTDFQQFTFSGHSRKLAVKSLMESIQMGHADYACYWSLELLCSGLVHTLWDTFFLAAAQYIHRSCPNMFVHLTKQYEMFAAWQAQYNLHTITEMRNREDVRYMVCDIAGALALARKQKHISLPTVKPEHDFNPVTMRENLKATTSRASEDVMKQEDPHEITIPLNELCFCLRPEVRDMQKALYWISWMNKFVSEYKKTTKQALVFAARENEFVGAKHCRHHVWMYWDAVMTAARQSPHSRILEPYIEALYHIYCLRWEPTDARSRQPYLTVAILFVCESQALDVHEQAKKDPYQLSQLLNNIPVWIQTILATKDSFSSR
jgi:hypothetical protein